MNLGKFKQHIESFSDGTQFKYGISAPFSWRGSYDEVAFSIVEKPMSKDEILANIQFAYTEMFYGYKGGEYYYNNLTPVNFEEEGSRNYSNGSYTAQMIAKIECEGVSETQTERLIKLAFTEKIK